MVANYLDPEPSFVSYGLARSNDQRRALGIDQSLRLHISIPRLIVDPIPIVVVAVGPRDAMVALLCLLMGSSWLVGRVCFQ